MNIREVEELTGLVRANIRYYEQEGFLTPERESNGYRNYTDEDVKVLKRIKLLRMLQVPIEEIRQIQSDELLMRTVLERSIRRAEEKKKELDSAQKICRQMNEDRVTWSTLDAERYLKQFGKTDEEEVKKEFSVSDYQVYEPHNIRRYFARLLDMQLYTLIIYLVYFWILSPGVHLSGANSTVVLLFGYALMFLLEPFFLHFLGTTPGKWIMGIHVHHMMGRNLTLEEGRRRTWNVLLWGYGLSIPIFSFVRLIKSAYDNMNCKALPWDNGGEYELEVAGMPTWKQWLPRVGGGIAVLVLSIGAEACIQAEAQYPVHRGLLTREELVENINTYMDALGIYSRWDLDDDLQWKELKEPGVVYIDVSTAITPQLEIVETDGYVTRISFKQTVTEDGMVSGFDGLVQALMFAYGGAQPEVTFWNGRLNEMLKLITENTHGGFSKQIAGLDIFYSLENDSYLEISGNDFFGEEGKEHSLTVTFSMTLSE